MLPIEKWKEMARRDDWHAHFVGSDIRQMLGEIERLERQVTHLNDLVDAYKRLPR